jgi:mRNA-degrading endonuclease toxin of MazEF toxin-antitoxin module
MLGAARSAQEVPAVESEIFTEWTEADVDAVIARQFDAIDAAEQEAISLPRGVHAGQVYTLRRSPDRHRPVPVLVVQNTTLNTLEPTTMVVRLTTQPLPRWRDYSVALPAAETGLQKDAAALCHQILTVLQADCERLMGTVSESSLQKVAERLRWCLGL